MLFTVGARTLGIGSFSPLLTRYFLLSFVVFLLQKCSHELKFFSLPQRSRHDFGREILKRLNDLISDKRWPLNHREVIC